MSDVLLIAATLVAAGAVMTFAVAALRYRRLLAGLPLALELLLGAGLLRLSAARSWTAIASAALVVAVRRIVVASLRGGAPP